MQEPEKILEVDGVDYRGRLYFNQDRSDLRIEISHPKTGEVWIRAAKNGPDAEQTVETLGSPVPLALMARVLRWTNCF